MTTELASVGRSTKIEDRMGGEENGFSIGRPGRIEAKIREPPHRLPGGTHEEETAALPLGAKHDLLAIR